MRPIDANDAAFPSFPMEGGLTKREYFAALALQGILASMNENTYCPPTAACDAVLAADVLLKRLEQNS